MRNIDGKRGNREGRESSTCGDDVKVVVMEHRNLFLEYEKGKEKVDEEGRIFEVVGGRKRAVVVGNRKSISPGSLLGLDICGSVIYLAIYMCRSKSKYVFMFFFW